MYLVRSVIVKFALPPLVNVNDLEQSSRAVTENQEELKVMGGALVTTKKLVSRYVRKENTTNILTLLAFLAFVFACFYVFLKRLVW